MGSSEEITKDQGDIINTTSSAETRLNNPAAQAAFVVIISRGCASMEEHQPTTPARVRASQLRDLPGANPAARLQNLQHRPLSYRGPAPGVLCSPLGPKGACFPTSRDWSPAPHSEWIRSAHREANCKVCLSRVLYRASVGFGAGCSDRLSGQKAVERCSHIIVCPLTADGRLELLSSMAPL